MSKNEIRKILTTSYAYAIMKLENKKERKRKINKNIESVQNWLPFEKILEEGIIKMKNGNYVKIIKVIPINFNLKSNLEKESILNSYKIFLKTCNFDIQIIIQSNKEDLSKHISKIRKKCRLEPDEIINISEIYVKYIESLNSKKSSSSKNYFILIKKSPIVKENDNENIIISELRDQFYKIKECLARCGNSVFEIKEKEIIINILNSFFNKI